MAKVSCILRHRDVQLILAYSRARPAILVAGKGRGDVFIYVIPPLLCLPPLGLGNILFFPRVSVCPSVCLSACLSVWCSLT